MPFSSDGSLVAFSYRTNDGIPIRVVEISSGRTLVLITDAGNTKVCANALAFSPDLRLLATGDCNGNIYLIVRDTWQVAATLLGHRGSVTGLAFSRDGKNLLSSSSDGTVRVWGISAP